MVLTLSHTTVPFASLICSLLIDSVPAPLPPSATVQVPAANVIVPSPPNPNNRERSIK